MKMFRIQENTPEVYTNTSRDFQLIGRLYDCVVNGIKFDTDSILRIVSTDSIDSKLLKLLQTKIGFFTSNDVTDEDLRYVLGAFPIIVKNKGSIKGITQAVRVFLKLKHIKSDVKIDVYNKYGTHPYTVQIGLNMPYTDTLLLDEILKYVIPTGYTVAYSFYNDIGNFDSVIDAKIGANIVVVKDSVSSLIRGNYISYENSVEDELIGSVGETQLSLPYNTSYIGVFDNISSFPTYVEKQDEHVGELLTLRVGNPWDDNFSLSSYMYMFNNNTNLYEWVLMNSTADTLFDVFKSSCYGYLNNNTFYINKTSEYVEDTTYMQSGIMISNDSTPDNAIIPVFENGVLYNPKSDTIWHVYNEEWVNSNASDFGVEIIGENPNVEENYVVPKENLIVYREGSQSVEEAVWKTEIINNSYEWGNAITDTDEILSLKEISSAKIIGEPTLCRIVSAKDDYLYSTESDTSWHINDNIWVEDSNLLYSAEINGNPNTGAFIIPDSSVHVYNDNTSWTASIDNYSEPIQPDSSVLYIDSSTSCGYKYDTNEQTFNEVLHFVKAKNVYNIDSSELNSMIENGLIRPAFKNNTTIFEDNFNNIVLL